MLTKRRNIILTAIGTLFCLFCITYISCTKTGLAPKCNGVLCLNGGFCDSGVCKCPKGYEGNNCGTVSVAKYINTYDVVQKVIGSDSADQIGVVTNYVMFLKTTATPTTFFINNFAGVASYNDIICTLDSTNSSNFTLDTLSNFHQWYDHYTMKGGSGHINATDSTISATFEVRILNSTVNWQRDTLQLTMKPHHF